MTPAVLPLPPLTATAEPLDGPLPAAASDAEYDRNADYNRCIDKKYGGGITLEGKTFTPSWILFRMDRPRYNAAVLRVKERFKQQLVQEFPSPIAQAFDKFQGRAQTARERLDHLRNTWEAMIWLLHTLTVAEARFLRLALKAARIRRDNGGVQAVAPKDLTSDHLATRLDVVKAIMELAEGANTPLATATLAPPAVVDRIRVLNRVRNDLAHRSPVSEYQAKRILSDCQDEVLDLLWKLKGLRKLRLIRYLSQVGPVVRHELFAGNGLFAPIKDLDLRPEQRQRAEPHLGEGAILAVIADQIFNLRPFVSCLEIEAGHAPRLYIYKKIENGAFQYEDLTTSQFHHHPKAEYQADLDDLRSLFGLAPEPVATL